MAITLNQHRAGITQVAMARFSDDKPPLMGLAPFFPSFTTTAKAVSIEVERNRQKIAVDVQRCTDPNRNTFSRSTEKIFIPPFFSESFDFTACQRYDVTFGMGSGPSENDAVQMAMEASDYVISLKNKILRAIEKQRADVLQTGIVTIKNGDSIDYKRKASSLVTLTGANQWSNPSTADPYKDLLAGANFLRKTGLSSGNRINAIFGETALTNFLSNTKVIAQADIRYITRIEANFPALDNTSGIQYQLRIVTGDFIIDIWTYSDFYEDASGNQVSYIDPNNIIMIPNDFVGRTAYAGVPMVMGDAISGFYIAPQAGEFHIHDVIDQVKKSWEMIVESAPLVVPISVDRTYTLTTVTP